MEKRIKARYAKKLVGFGKHLKGLRNQKKMTQEQLAYESGVSFTTLNKLENGHLNPTLATVYAIADSLKVDVKELFD
jgi:DNA-binding XRE family transcriptional regulator